MNQQIYSSTPQQIRSYIQQLLQSEMQNKQEFALETLFQYITRKKHQWSIHLQKITYHFFDLSFILNKHYLTKEVLKAYRAVTQSQYTDSLKVVLEYYRDKRLDVILKQQIETKNLSEITEIEDIESEESPQDLLISSFKIEEKKERDQLKINMKIVWDGYKSIIQTVKINQKLQELYFDTLKKLFEFAQKYNRKHEFKRFCDTIRTGLQNIFNKNKANQNENQKSMFIDIEKEDVNERNVVNRLDQFEVAVKLGLWQQSFQILEDINLLLKIRKGVPKKVTLSKYFFNLARLFRKSNYWNYHAFAYFNYYNTFKKNPKITKEQVQSTTDYLLLSVMCIPPFSIEKNQSDESQNKICSLITSTNHIPNKAQLYNLVVQKGIVQNASEHIKQLWTFLFLDFNILQVPNKVYLLTKLKSSHEDFNQLIENIIIYNELIQISKIYKKVRLTNILKIIPFNRESILKILLTTREREVLQFQFDEKNNLIIFKEKQSETDTYNELVKIAKQVTFITESIIKPETQYIIRKAVDEIEEAAQNKKIRDRKIQQFKIFLRKPRKQLQQQQKQREQKEKKKKEEEDKQERQKQRARKEKQIIRVKQLNTKKIIINDIIKIKQRRLIKVLGKKIQDLDDNDFELLTIEDLQQLNKQTQKKNKQDAENKFKKAYSKADYLERERRQRLVVQYKQNWQTSEKQIQEVILKSKQQYEKSKANKAKLLSTKQFINEEIEKQTEILKKKYEEEVAQYKKRITNQYKSKILERAKELKMIADQQKKRQDQEKAKKQIERLKRAELEQKQSNDIWIRGRTVVTTTTQPSIPQPKKDLIFERKAPVPTVVATNNITTSQGPNPLLRGKQLGNFRNNPQKQEKVIPPTTGGLTKKQQKPIGLGIGIGIGKKLDQKPPVKKEQKPLGLGLGLKKEQKKQEKPATTTKPTGRKFI